MWVKKRPKEEKRQINAYLFFKAKSMDVSKLFTDAQDHPEPVRVPVQGTLPEWLRGTYYKIGPGKFDLPGGFTVNHYFDGYAIIYQFKINNDKTITFRAKYIQSDAYKRAMAVGKPTFTEFGTKAYRDPDRNVVSRIIAKVMPSDMTDNVIGNLITIRRRLYASTESSFIRAINAETLDTGDKLDLWKTVGVNFCSSHFLRDRDGSVYNTGVSLVPLLKYHVFKIPPESTGDGDKNPLRDAIEVASFSPSWKTCFGYNHSFTLTDRFVVYIEQPQVINIVKLLASQVKGKSLRECMDWHPDEKTRFWLVEKATGNVSKIRYEANAMFFYHFVNAYEEMDQVVVDLLAYNTPVMCEKFLLANMRQTHSYETQDHPGFRRYVLPISKPKDCQDGQNLVTLKYTSAEAHKTKGDSIFLTPELIQETGFDHPCINQSLCLGRKYRYMYAGGLYGEDTIYRRTVFKMDVSTHQLKLWKNAEESLLGEPTFIPTPNSKDEDDGVVLTTVCDIRPDHPSSLVVLDARTMTEIARANIPIPLKLLNHGYFVSPEEI